MHARPLRAARTLLAVLILATSPWAQLGAQSGEAPTVESVSKLQAAAEAGGSADAAVYSEALAALQHAAQDAETAARFARETAAVPERIAELQAELAAAPADEQLSSEDLGLEELQRRDAEATGALERARSEVRDLEQLATQRSARMTDLPGEILAAQAEAEAERQALAALPQTAEQAAQRTLHAARAEAAARRADALSAELASYEALGGVLPLRRDLAARETARAEHAAGFWQRALQTVRANRAEQAAGATERRLDSLLERFPALAPLIAGNRELSELRAGTSGLPRRLAEAHDALAELTSELDETRARHRAANRRMAAGGLTEATAITLRRDYERLPREARLRVQAQARERHLSQAQLELIGVEEQRDELSDLPGAVDEFLAELDGARLEQVGEPAASGTEPAGESQELRAAATELLSDRREALDAARDGLSLLTTELFEQRRVAGEVAAEVGHYRAFIEKHILWVRSAPANPLPTLLEVPKHALELASAGWGPSLTSARTTIEKRPAEAAVIVLVLGVLLMGRRFLKGKREEMALQVRSYRTDSFVCTVRALIQTLLLALPLPLCLWGLGWLLEPSGFDLVRSLGSSLGEVAWMWLVLRFLRGLLAEKSLGPAHFKWPAAAMATARRQLAWFEPVAIPLAVVTFTLDRQEQVDWSNSVGRACFVARMAAGALASHRLLRADSPVWSTATEEGRGLVARTRNVWAAAVWIFPALLGVTALLGYYYTAQRFELHLRYSLLFAFALVLVNALLLRWLFITRRRLAVSQALEERARRQKEIEAVATESGASTDAERLDADKVDIPAVDARTRQLFRSSLTLATVFGLYLIWASALPALQGLDRVQLWPRPALLAAEPNELVAPASPAAPEPTAAAVEGRGTGDAASEPVALPLAGPALRVPEEASEPAGAGSQSALPASVTLANVLVAVLILLLTNVAGRNLPALLELALLQRLPLDSGARYAVTTILRYLILILGVSATSTALGIGWRDIQWLVAALTFGLAFGLQEIFANFVSGLIILLERPVRVGDIVTVAGTEGRVTQLRMRATTILDWDRRELLVPNKEFITSPVTNWTLSDPITRVIVPVGIAYGSDTARARELLLKVASDERLVLQDPTPNAIFRGFGESTLNFELRVFIANRDLWPAAIDGIHTRIDEAFRDAKIEIAFPQRDLHIRTAEGLATLAPREAPLAAREATGTARDDRGPRS